MTTAGPSWGDRFPGRATLWRLRTRTLHFANTPIVMGVVNVTPDSFSDGGRYCRQADAVAHGLRLAADGAGLIDVGGESTRPFGQPVSVDEELRRVIPVVEAICRTTDVPVSIDTAKARVAAEALAAGAEVINDVTGLAHDPDMVELAATTAAGLCAMHMQGTPQTMQIDPTYDDLLGQIGQYLRQRRDALRAAGILPDRICLDPGIGFGKTHRHNLDLLAQCHRFHQFGCPLLVGPSRKGFIGKVLGDDQADRAAGTVGVALALARQGVQIVRVHDVRPVRDALALYEAAGGLTL